MSGLFIETCISSQLFILFNQNEMTHQEKVYIFLYWMMLDSRIIEYGKTMNSWPIFSLLFFELTFLA